MSATAASRRNYAILLVGGFVAIALTAATSLYSYALFHTIVEIFTMIIAGTVFTTVWNTRGVLERHYLLFVGIAFFFFVILNIPHTLGFQGIELFEGFDANLPTQLFIIQRYMLSIALVVALVFLRRQLPIGLTFTAFAVLTVLALASTMVWRNFPDAFVPGEGLTPFKIYSEYVISGIFLVALLGLWANRSHFDRRVLQTLTGATGALIFSELMFTLYATPSALPNFLGHIAQIVAFYLVYVAVVRTALERPYALLYRGLAESERRNRDVAETLQSSLLEISGALPSVEIAHEYRAASEVSRIGGDFYDVFELGGDRMGILLGDVSGKGLGAAATTATVKSTVRALAYLRADAAFVLEKANHAMHSQLADDQFVTVGFAVLDRSSGTLEYGNAGHTDPVICGDGACTLMSAPRNLPLGVFPNATFEPVEWKLEPGHLFVLYSDGLTDARNDGRFFGEEGIVQGLNELRSLPCDEMIGGLVERADRFSQGLLPDDTAVLAVRYMPGEETAGAVVAKPV